MSFFFGFDVTLLSGGHGIPPPFISPACFANSFGRRQKPVVAAHTFKMRLQISIKSGVRRFGKVQVLKGHPHRGVRGRAPQGKVRL